MKISILTLALCCLSATAAFGQAGQVLSNVSNPVSIPDNPQHASAHAMGEESNLLGSSAYSYGHGEQPLWEFGTDRHDTPLGDVARAFRKGHVLDKKATKVLQNY